MVTAEKDLHGLQTQTSKKNFSSDVTPVKKLPTVRVSLCSFVEVLEVDYFLASSCLGCREAPEKHIFFKSLTATTIKFILSFLPSFFLHCWTT